MYYIIVAVNIFHIFTLCNIFPHIYIVLGILCPSSFFNPHNNFVRQLLSVQFSSVIQPCLTLWDPMDCSMPGFLVHHQLPELAQTHVHQVGDVLQPSHPLSSVPFSSRLQSFPAAGSFQMSQFFTSGGQSIGVSASASVLPTNIQHWFPLGLTGFILQSKGLSRVFSNTTVQKHRFFGAQLFL